VSEVKNNCRDCGERAVLVLCRPKRYDDGFRRCRDCTNKRVAAIRAYWIGASGDYSPRGGRGGYGSDAA
jgi:hypothetical protein